VAFTRYPCVTGVMSGWYCSSNPGNARDFEFFHELRAAGSGTSLV
jgi:hypothetical protein